MTKLSSIGEFGLIKRISSLFTQNLPEGIIGIGDDCAVIPLDNHNALLVTTDMLIEDSHFLLSKIRSYELGYKSLAVNLSDIAAMGGKPESAFLSIGIPYNIEVEWLDDFFNGLKSLLDKTGTKLLGGDTTKSPDKLVINIVLIGKVSLQNIRKRSMAKPGDIICLTGTVGDSGGGLCVLLQNLNEDEESNYLVEKHHMPFPQLKEGEWLARQNGVNAMIDLSDGIESDIQRIMESSHIGAEIELAKLPVSEQLKSICKKFQWDLYEIAATGGEDYCLMVTIDKQHFDEIQVGFEKKFGCRLFNIGKITERQNGLIFKSNGKIVILKKHGFDHFNNK